MKRFGSLFLAATLLVLTACGGRGAATKGAADNQSPVAQLMENAARDTEAEPPLPVSDAPASSGQQNGGSASDSEAFPPESPAEQTHSTDGVDIDLTRMNATMVFAEVSNIMYMPDDYIGKIIRMNGMAVSSTDPETGITYHAVIIQDATACCASGLDYILAEGQEYPPDETDVTVTGEFELYEENGFFYCQLKDAALGA